MWKEQGPDWLRSPVRRWTAFGWYRVLLLLLILEMAGIATGAEILAQEQAADSTSQIRSLMDTAAVYAQNGKPARAQELVIQALNVWVGFFPNAYQDSGEAILARLRRLGFGPSVAEIRKADLTGDGQEEIIALLRLEGGASFAVILHWTGEIYEITPLLDVSERDSLEVDAFEDWGPLLVSDINLDGVNEIILTTTSGAGAYLRPYSYEWDAGRYRLLWRFEVLWHGSLRLEPSEQEPPSIIMETDLRDKSVFRETPAGPHLRDSYVYQWNGKLFAQKRHGLASRPINSLDAFLRALKLGKLREAYDWIYPREFLAGQEQSYAAFRREILQNYSHLVGARWNFVESAKNRVSSGGEESTYYFLALDPVNGRVARRFRVRYVYDGTSSRWLIAELKAE